MRCKGIKTCEAQNKLTIDKFRDVLFTKRSLNIEQNNIRSYKHQLYTEKVNKVALSCTDDKVYICENDIDTFNFGHYITKQINI